MSGNTDTEILANVQRQGRDNEKKLDRILKILDGDDGDNIGLRAEMRDLKRQVRDYNDHEQRIKALKTQSTQAKGMQFRRKSVVGTVLITLTIIGGFLTMYTQLSNLIQQALTGAP